MIYKQFLLSETARKLYGNAYISLKQAASYANTPEKQLLCYKGLIAVVHSCPHLSAEECYELNKMLRALFPPLNHREQA